MTRWVREASRGWRMTAAVELPVATPAGSALRGLLFQWIPVELFDRLLAAEGLEVDGSVRIDPVSNPLVLLALPALDVFLIMGYQDHFP